MLEVDAFTTFDQRERRFAVEVEMPKIAHQPDTFPIAHARQESIHQYDLAHVLRILRSVRIRDHQADIMPDYRDRLVIAELMHEVVDVLGHRFLVVSARRALRSTD